MRNRLKYYLRGLGTGMLVTASIFILIGGSGSRENASLTDEQIIERAKELGMVEVKTLAELSSLGVNETTEPNETSETNETTESNETTETNETSETNETTEPDETTESNETLETNETTETNVTTASNVATGSSESMKSNEFTESNKTNTGETGTDGVNETTVPGEKIATTIRIVISRGDSSLAVSRVLETENLVEDAREFDRFLCDEEYDHSLRVGEHYIPSGATWGEIARIITGAG